MKPAIDPPRAFSPRSIPDVAQQAPRSVIVPPHDHIVRIFDLAVAADDLRSAGLGSEVAGRDDVVGDEAHTLDTSADRFLPARSDCGAPFGRLRTGRDQYRIEAVEV